MSGGLRRSRRGLRRAVEEAERALEHGGSSVPGDPVEFCRGWLGYEPYAYMWPFLRDGGHFVALLQARQTGKTFNGMAKLLWYAFRYPGSLILVTAPKLDQVRGVAFRALREHLEGMRAARPGLFDYAVGRRNVLRAEIRFRNGSVIRGEAPVPETIRGHSAKVVYLMEANFIRDDEELYAAVLFTLNTTEGYLIAESTPWSTDSVFYRMFHDPTFGQFSTHRLVYTEALPPDGPLSPEIVGMIEEQLAGDPSRWRREMLCEWTEDTDVWLPMSLISTAQDSTIDYIQADARPRGEFYVGVDFGKHRDHSVVAVVERKGVHLYLRQCHQFPLGVSYGSVIGYVKRLQDSWRRVRAVYADKTGVGEYIVEDMRRGGLRSVTGVNFMESSKEQMATALKEAMRSAVCPVCGWEGHVDAVSGKWRTSCPKGCSNDEGVRASLRPLLHIPFDPDLFHELNVERYELSKSGKLLFNHPQGTNDDRFWALSLAIYAADQIQPMSGPIARTI